MKKTKYVAPCTSRFSVELEGGFTSASVVTDDPKSGVTSTGQEWNEISGDTWNSTTDDANGWAQE